MFQAHGLRIDKACGDDHNSSVLQQTANRKPEPPQNYPPNISTVSQLSSLLFAAPKISSPTSPPDPQDAARNRLSAAIAEYKDASEKALQRLRSAYHASTGQDAVTRSNLFYKMQAEQSKQADRAKEFKTYDAHLTMALALPLPALRQRRFEEFVTWLEKCIEELSDVGV